MAIKKSNFYKKNSAIFLFVFSILFLSSMTPVVNTGIKGYYPADLTKAQDSLTIMSSFDAKEARQGIAVGKDFIYVIGTKVIGKYDKNSFKFIAQWNSKKDTGIIHLDSGVEFEGKLYCAHSNYPQLPMTSSVEVWDTKTLKHIANHSFGIKWGSFTWLDRHDGFWWGAFAHYQGYASKTGSSTPLNTSPKWSTLVKFNNDWQPLEEWVFPASVIEKTTPYSISGGSWGPDGLLYCSGHDRNELYLLKLPDFGSEMVHVTTLPFPSQGQGIAWDRSAPGVIYGIRKKERKVIACTYNNPKDG